MELQLAWTGTEVVAWAWDGRPARRMSTTSPLYGLMVREWGWMPPGSWGTRIALDSPFGKLDLPAIVMPGGSIVDMGIEPRRRQDLSPSSRWVRQAVRLARHAVANGYARPKLTRDEMRQTGWQAGWAALITDDVVAALTELAASCPPIVRAASRPDRVTAGAPLPADALGFTIAFHEWLVGIVTTTVLRTGRWTPDLVGMRSAEASAMRAVGKGLGALTGDLGSLRAEPAIAVLPMIARSFERLHAGATGEPLVAARLRLAIPADPADPEAPWPLTIELTDRDDASRWCSADDVWNQTPLAMELAGRAEHLPVLQKAVLAARDRLVAITALADVTAPFLGVSNQPAMIELDIDGAAAILDAVEDLAAADLPLIAPGLLVTTRPSVRASAKPVAESDGRLGMVAMVSFSMTVDGHTVDEAVLERAAATGATLMQAGGRWVRVDRTAARKALDAIRGHRRDRSTVDPAALLRLAAELAAATDSRPADDGSGTTGTDPIEADGWLGDLLAGLPDDRLDEGEPDPAFTGTLRPYQRRGLGWLQFLARIGFGGCLADDMGLGKTPTTLAHLAGRPGPHLVLCPLSVVRNWQSEAARFWPLARVVVHHGTTRDRGGELAAAVGAADLVITTYGLAVRDAEELGAVEWSTVVLDEAQAVKNSHTNAARMVRKLRAAQKVALTGTPVENRLGELWAILDVVNPGLLGSERQFHDRWTIPIERHGEEEVAAQLRKLTGPFVLRRTKADRSLVPDLPDKVEQLAWASLTREQATMYQSVVDQLLAEAEASEGMKRRGLVLAALTRLKQICNHPAQAAGDGSKLAGRSGKLARFDELLADLLDAGERALVFTQYREMGLLLQRHIAATAGIDVPFLHGGVARSTRDKMVDQFQAGTGAPVLLVSLKAGGTGLNLTNASRVIHYDRWWNPAVEDQATDRAWRIGQTRSVFVHKLVCQGTIEERIAELIDDKRRLAGMVIGAGSGEAWLSELSTSDLRDLVVLGAEAVER